MQDWQKYLLFGGGALIVFVVLLIFVFTGGTGDGRSGPGGDGMAGGDGRSSEGRFSEPFFNTEGGVIDPARALAQYEAYSVYPPTSRPLTRDMPDLLQPNQRYETFLPVGGPPEDFRNRNPEEIEAKAFYLFSGDRYFVIGDESITLHLRAAERPFMDVAREPVRILEATLNKGQSHLNYTKVQDIGLNDDGRNGDRTKDDRIYTVKLTPAEIPAISNYHGRLQVYCKFEAAGVVTEALIPFEYFPPEAIPARFTGGFSDVIEEGSLVVYTQLDVRKPGYYIIDANLFDADENPVAYTRFKGELKAGKQEARLLFFGKVIRDQNGRPPFYVDNVRGYRLLEGQSPDRELIPPLEEAYRTRGSYDFDDFSADEYQSEQKRRKLEFLRQQMEQGVGMPEQAQ